MIVYLRYQMLKTIEQDKLMSPSGDKKSLAFEAKGRYTEVVFNDEVRDEELLK